MKDLSGQTLGQYTIEAPIGQGGMAAVYKAYQARVRRYVAIKVLPEVLASDPSFIARFQREAFTIAQLEHPAILPVYDYGEADNITYIVMRYVDTGSLASRLKLGPLSYAEIKRLIRQVSEGLSYAHRQGVIHRDLKPDNIFLDSEGNALLGDFGIAHITEGTQELTGNAVIGTPSYMSPEQGRGRGVDGRSDIYSLGIILFELFTGQVPYKADNPMGIVVKHITEPMPDPRTIKAEIPAEVAAVIMKATAKDPDDRYNTPLALASELEAALNGTGETVPGSLADTRYVGPTAQTVLEPGTSSLKTVAETPSIAPTPAVTKEGSDSSGRKFPIWVVAAALLALCVVCGSALALAAVLKGGGNNNNNNSVVLGTSTPSEANSNENNNDGRDPSVISSLPTTELGDATPENVPTIEIPTPAAPNPSGAPSQAVPPDFVGMQIIQSSFLGNGGQNQFEFANIFEGGISGAVQPVGNLDLIVEIIDGNGNSYLTVDQFAEGGTEVFSFTPPTQAGDYFVVVSEFNGQSGNFTIVLDGTPAIFFVVNPQDSIAGRVEGDSTASFFFQGLAGRTLTVQVTPDNTLDAVIRLFRDADLVTAIDTGVVPDPLFQTDDFVEGGVETLTYTFAQNGVFIVDVGGFAGGSGTFTMTISQ
ncbi:MAG: serine/threonine-protein kinase [Candidatus Promineifilaceae bacterium]